MKIIALSFCLLFVLLTKAQKDQVIVYKNTVDGYSFQYPQQWDSVSFSPIKERFKVDFGATIKATFNDNKTGAYFTLKRSDSFGADLNVTARETEASLKKIYPDAKIINSRKANSKNKIPYYSLTTQIDQFGSTRITNKVQIIKGNSVYVFNFICPKDGYEKLHAYFEALIDSFMFETL
jgi:hypothetical protein